MYIEEDPIADLVGDDAVVRAMDAIPVATESGESDDRMAGSELGYYKRHGGEDDHIGMIKIDMICQFDLRLIHLK